VAVHAPGRRLENSIERVAVDGVDPRTPDVATGRLVGEGGTDGR
jgi:hypothetical protein